MNRWFCGSRLCLGLGALGLVLGCSSGGGDGPTGPNLAGQDLSGDDLSGRDFSGAQMTNTNLENAVVDDADFSGAVLNGANLSGVDFTDAELDGVTAQHLTACPEELPEGWLCTDLGATGLTLLGPSTVLDGVDLTGATLSERTVEGMQAIRLLACPAELPSDWKCIEFETVGLTLMGPEANLSGLDLRDADLSSVHNLDDVSFAGANLSGATFGINAELSDADFTGADLTGASFGEDTDLEEARFSGANLSGVSLAGAELMNVSAAELVSCPEALPSDWSCRNLGPSGYTLVGPGADLSHLDLTGGDLSEQNLQGADFDASILTRVNFDGADLKDADLQDVVATNMTWSSTICPDGSNSDTNGGSCL